MALLNYNFLLLRRLKKEIVLQCYDFFDTKLKKERLNYKEASAESLVLSCVLGERGAQEELYARFSAKMYAACLRYAKDTEEAQEFLQTGFIKVFQNLEKYGNKGSLEGWIRTIIIRNALDSLKKTSKYNEVELEESTGDLFISDEETSMYESLSQDIILNEIQKLDENLRLVFNLFHLDDMSHKEIAQELNILESTSRSILRRAKIQLKDVLGKYIDY